MKKIIYILFLAFVFVSCGNEDQMYEGEQFFSLGKTSPYAFVVNENNTKLQIPFGLAYPADEDLNFTVFITQNSAAPNVTVNGKTEGVVDIHIPKGEMLGHIDIDANYDKLITGASHSLKLSLNRKSVPYAILDSIATISISKFCSLNQELIKEWEGKYAEVPFGSFGDPNIKMDITWLNGDTLLIKNFMNLDYLGSMGVVKDPQPVKVVIDYSTNNYKVSVVTDKFYISNTYGQVHIHNKYFDGTPLYNAVDNCSKEMIIEFTQIVPQGFLGYGYRKIRKIE